MLRQWRNVPAAILAHDRSRVGLDPDQRAALSAAADTIDAGAARIADALARGVTDLGGTDAARVEAALTRQRRLLGEARLLLDGGAATARSTLTPQQWGALPASMRAEVRVPMPLLPVGGVQLLPDF